MAETPRIGRFPAWVAEAVVYQVFPDRFRRSGRVKAQQGLSLQPWGTEPLEHGFQGGLILRELTQPLFEATDVDEDKVEGGDDVEPEEETIEQHFDRNRPGAGWKLHPLCPNPPPIDAQGLVLDAVPS